MATIGAALGAALFALLIRVVPPRTSALVQLGRFDACRAKPTRVYPSADRNATTTAPTGGGPLAGIAAAVAGELEGRGLALAGLRQDLA